MTSTSTSTNHHLLLQSLQYDSAAPSLQILDQLLLPDVTQYVDVPDIDTTFAVIRNMQVRGAPLIAVVACLGLAVDVQSAASQRDLADLTRSVLPQDPLVFSKAAVAAAVRAYLCGKLEYLGTSRPTAVNLFHAIAELKAQLLNVNVEQEQELIQQHYPIHPDPNTHNTNGADTENPGPMIVQAFVRVIIDFAEALYARDIADCHAMGRHGAQALLDHIDQNNSSNKNHHHQKKKKKLTVMTICNTGSLATSGIGTALGVIRTLHAPPFERLQQCIALETRPYNQGSRLTAYEMVVDALPHATLLCDSMAGAYLAGDWNTSTSSSTSLSDTSTDYSNVDAIVVGADRVCANGDTANKIGTYSLAVLALHHQVPFFVAAPFTTLDLHTRHGRDIHIEQRPAHEVIDSARAPSTTSTQLHVWNPAFDVTPAHLITGGIITEHGVLYRDPVTNTFDVKAFVQQHQQQSNTNTSNHKNEKSGSHDKACADNKADVPTSASSSGSSSLSYIEQTVDSLPTYLAQHAPAMVMHDVLQANRASDLSCIEFGDGNLNLVFLVRNTSDDAKAAVIVKQALPYVRCVGADWPMTLERAYFEQQALQIQYEACPDHTPRVYFFDRALGLMVMQYLPPPLQILRTALITRELYPRNDHHPHVSLLLSSSSSMFARQVGTFCARTLFSTSGYALTTPQALRERVEEWSRNRDLCALTEAVVFTEPYLVDHPHNRWTSPELDADKAAMEADEELKLAACYWKERFVTQTVALVHGDLHSGSVMCSHDQTFVIDPEFAFYGPMGFDLGAFIANLFLNAVSQSGHNDNDNNSSSSSSSPVDERTYVEWVLQQVKLFWETFVSEFLALWNDPATHTGFLYSRELLDYTATSTTTTRRPMIQCIQSEFVSRLLNETLGFCGMKMVRRVVGIAHVADLDSIPDRTTKVKCERRALYIGTHLIKTTAAAATAATSNNTPASFQSMDEAIEFVRIQTLQ